MNAAPRYSLLWGKNEEAVSKVMCWWRTEEGSTEKYAPPAGHTHTLSHTHSESRTCIHAGRKATQCRHT